MSTNSKSKIPPTSTKIPFWKKKRFILPVLFYLIYKLFYPTYWWCEKMTVTVNTPQGEVSGSAVRSIKVVYQPSPLAEIGGRVVTLEGEAVTVDLGDGKYLFALLGAPAGWAGVIYNDVIPDAKGGFSELDLWASSLRGKGALDLPRSKYPSLATFRNLNNSNSVREVIPDKLDEIFGSGYSLKSITLEITRESVTDGKVKNLLSWLGEHPEPALLDKLDPNDFSFEAKYGKDILYEDSYYPQIA